MARTGALIWILTVGLEVAVILMLELFRTSAYREAPMPPREEDVQTAVQSEAAIETKAEVKADDTGTLAEQADSSVVPGEATSHRCCWTESPWLKARSSTRPPNFGFRD